MDDYYYNATHEVFISMIGLHYVYPLPTAYNYANICNSAINAGYEVVAMLHDGVVYKYTPEKE